MQAQSHRRHAPLLTLPSRKSPFPDSPIRPSNRPPQVDALINSSRKQIVFSSGTVTGYILSAKDQGTFSYSKLPEMQQC